MSILKKGLLVAGVVVLAGCRIEASVPVGGAVSTDSGQYRLETGESASIEVNDVAFHEVFNAEPAAGYLFAGWEKQERGMCGGSLEPCELYTSWMAGEDSLLAILESDEAFFLAPTFLPADQINLYEIGDRVSFSGTLLEQQDGDTQASIPITARMEIVTPTYTLNDKNVVAARLTVLNEQQEEVMVRTTHFWQEEGGAFHDLNDEYGNYYHDTATNESGLESIPAPLVPFASNELQFSIMYSGHTSTPLTVGTRSIEVGEAQAVSVPLVAVSAYPVTISDSWSYLTTFADFKRDEVVERELSLWVSQVKGIIKSSETRRWYSSTGKLLGTTTLELEAIQANF